MTGAVGDGKPASVPDVCCRLGGPWVTADDIEGVAPSAPGAYLLALWVPAPVPLPPRLAVPPLTPGWYVYAGSARGPGGLRARLRRHMRPDKARHWHIDWLTTAPDVSAWALVRPAATECALIAEAMAHLPVSVPVPGFGSSDCRRCVSHLLALA
ncbi:DUF123 domain-containing protein [uncultured Rhodospira sp.]|uniref:GIY-YIG nuclease family protein n=1 Tax=uncultured Rhodospira sp. TaxID=1936189 RepID=UPI00260EEAFC|nr:GIY-YIG nuclease family protein [uncultured Rhodospira sp.]